MKENYRFDIPYKKCRICGRVYPLWHYRKYKRSPDGHYYYCSDCEREYKREWYRKNRETAYEKHRGWVWRNETQMRILQGTYRMRQKLIAKGELSVDYVKRLRRPLTVQEVVDLGERKKRIMKSGRTWRDLFKDKNTGENE